MSDAAQAAEDERGARRRLAAGPATRRLADAALSPLTGGESNRTWRLDHGGETLFLRLNAPGAAGLGVDRASECRLLQAASGAGIAPEVVRCDPEAGLLLTRFVEARPWSRQEAGDAANLRRIGALLRRLHDLSADPAIRLVSFPEQARRLEGLLGPGSLPPLLTSAAALRFKRLERRAACCLCHNDPHHLNVLDDGQRLWLVDWEYGGRGDPVYDLAACLSQLQDGERDRLALWEGYGSPPPCTDAELSDACWVFDYVQWLWYRVQAAASPEPSGVFTQKTRELGASLEQRLQRP
jgi:thiamine kinase-like enzyme